MCLLCFYVVTGEALVQFCLKSKLFIALPSFLDLFLFLFFFSRYAVVTGSNNGIGLATVKGFASNVIKIVLTARNQKRGLHAIEKLGMERV